MRRAIGAWQATILALVGATACYGQPTVPVTDVRTAEPVVANGQTWVLLIAVDNYRELGKLRYSCNDAKVLKDRLVATGIPADHVMLMTDDAEEHLKPIKRNFDQQLQTMLSRAGKDDLVILTASIHGVSIDGVSYLCPIDTSLKEVQQRVTKGTAPESATLIFRPRHLPADGTMQTPAGNSSSSTRAATPLPRKDRSRTTSANPVNFGTPPKGVWLVSSCRADQASFEDEKLKHGLFMNFLIEGLDGQADSPDGNNDGKIQFV